MIKNKLMLGVIMDPIQHIIPAKDTTLALLLKAQERNFDLYYMELKDLRLQYGKAWGKTRSLKVFDDKELWYELGEPLVQPLEQFDVLLMRKDPPVDMNYIYATYILEHAEQNGTLVVNRPQALRDANEKLYTTWFPHCMPENLVSADISALKEFLMNHQAVVFKPLAGMGGKSIYKCQVDDPNLNVILETLTQEGKELIMAQRFITDIYESGDKRIFLIDGEPFPFALQRIPVSSDFRGNLAAGGNGIGCRLSDRDKWIAAQVGPMMIEKGFLFVGLDVIGDYLTEINVTSPTCVREVEHQFNVDISGHIIDCILEKLET